jgi:hypothetical protein
MAENKQGSLNEQKKWIFFVFSVESVKNVASFYKFESGQEQRLEL